MNSEWRVSSQSMDEEKIYQVYRILNTDKIDHGGNREYLDMIFKHKELAQRSADTMNHWNKD